MFIFYSADWVDLIGFFVHELHEFNELFVWQNVAGIGLYELHEFSLLRKEVEGMH